MKKYFFYTVSLLISLLGALVVGSVLTGIIGLDILKMEFDTARDLGTIGLFLSFFFIARKVFSLICQNMENAGRRAVIVIICLLILVISQVLIYIFLYVTLARLGIGISFIIDRLLYLIISFFLAIKIITKVFKFLCDAIGVVTISKTKDD